MMTKMFELQLGNSIEVYIDDMVVKSKMVKSKMVKSKMVFEHVGDLINIFEILRKHKIRLNASKCSFGGVRQVSGLYGDSPRNRS